ncbi:helix-turn-helix domain-containing protein [Sutcliffiella cohnii]
MLGKRLRKARMEKKLTQEDLAKLVNTKKTTISNYETGYSSPSNEMLVDLANVLGVTTDYLLGRTESKHDGVLINRVSEQESIYFFDKENITQEELEALKEHLEFLRYKAEKENSKKSK